MFEFAICQRLFAVDNINIACCPHPFSRRKSYAMKVSEIDSIDYIEVFKNQESTSGLVVSITGDIVVTMGNELFGVKLTKIHNKNIYTKKVFTGSINKLMISILDNVVTKDEPCQFVCTFNDNDEYLIVGFPVCDMTGNTISICIVCQVYDAYLYHRQESESVSL